MKKYIVVIKYNFDSNKPTWVYNTLKDAWDNLLEILNKEKETVVNEQEYTPYIKILEDCKEAILYYNDGTYAEYFILEIDL